MATAVDEAAIPATVTINGEELFDSLVEIVRAQEAVFAFNGRQDTPLSLDLDRAIGTIFRAAFGGTTRDCDLGTEEPGCQCLACNGDMLDSATPLYRRLLVAADAA